MKLQLQEMFAVSVLALQFRPEDARQKSQERADEYLERELEEFLMPVTEVNAGQECYFRRETPVSSTKGK